jgi:hypothetical protein
MACIASQTLAIGANDLGARRLHARVAKRATAPGHAASRLNHVGGKTNVISAPAVTVDAPTADAPTTTKKTARPPSEMKHCIVCPFVGGDVEEGAYYSFTKERPQGVLMASETWDGVSVYIVKTPYGGGTVRLAKKAADSAPTKSLFGKMK